MTYSIPLFGARRPKVRMTALPVKPKRTFASSGSANATSGMRLWCKRQDLARYDVGRAAGGVGMGKLIGVERLFEGRHLDREVIILCVRCDLRFKLSLRDLV